jgi:hypothetical protein
MISVENLILKINDLIAAGSLSEDAVAHLTKAVDSLERKGLGSVLSLNEISAADNPGRIVYVKSEYKYYISNGTQWVTNVKFILDGIDVRSPMYGWGYNTDGRVGDNTTTSRRSPVAVAGGFTDWVQTSAGATHSTSLRANGTLWAWGRNGNLQLGDGTTAASRRSPVSVVGNFTDWVSAKAGSLHNLGLRANGSLWAWGGNSGGCLGDNTTANRNSPVSVVGGITDWASIGTGSSISFAIRADGTLWAWGGNTVGQLGDNTVTSRLSPVSVVGGFTDWVQVDGGGTATSNGFALGLRANGTLWAWGINTSGQLGDGTVVSRRSPVSVVGGFTDWVQVGVGILHTLAIRANGSLWAWGSNGEGRLGDNTTANKSSPVSVVGGFTDWVNVDPGIHSIGVRANGTLWAWGRNPAGGLGDGTITNRNSPVSVLGGFTDWVDASAGEVNHSSGVRA